MARLRHLDPAATAAAFCGLARSPRTGLLQYLRSRPYCYLRSACILDLLAILSGARWRPRRFERNFQLCKFLPCAVEVRGKRM